MILFELIGFALAANRLVAEIYFGLGNPVGAVKIAPWKWEYHFLIGGLYIRRQDYSTAAHHYREALKLAPYYLDATNNLAASYALSGRPDVAIAIYQEVLKFRPLNEVAKENLEKLTRLVEGRAK